MGKLPQEFRKFIKNCHILRRILKDTQRSLDEINNSNLFPGENIAEQFLNHDLVNSLQNILECSPVILVFGQNCDAKALFVNSLLNQILLPLHSTAWRWVRLHYGNTKRIRLTLGHDFEIVEKFESCEQHWYVVPESDLKRTEHETPLEHCPTLDVEINHPILKDCVQIIIPPDDGAPTGSSREIFKNLEQVWPVIIYAITEDALTDTNVQEINKIKEAYTDLPILFVSFPYKHDSTAELTESEQHLVSAEVDNKITRLKTQFERLGYLNVVNEDRDNSQYCSDCSTENCLITENEIHERVLQFSQSCLKSHLFRVSALLSEIHNNSLRRFILSAFDMAREIQITPRRIQYAQARESELYKTLTKLAGDKQEEITRLIQITLQKMKANVGDVLEGYQEDNRKIATLEIQQIVLRKIRNSVATQLIESVACLQESFVGTLQRCLESLEKNCNEYEGNQMASDAVKQILTAAYNVDLKSSTSFSVLHTFVERLRKLLHGFRWATANSGQGSQFNTHQVVTEMIDSLSSVKLARTISIQFQEHVKSSHDSFQAAMKSLEQQLSGKLEQTEEQRIAIRKYHAPRFARLALESTSMCDMVRWGMPKIGKEIGRGQYGVVFASEPWAGIDPCAVKSVVPPDDRHWNDLAMEFYYTRTIPEHPRIVKLRGSVVDQSYGPAVLLITERLTRDLYCGLRSGLSWTKRLQIAIDVVEGIRYLHSQGLVHRDIKLKNVLLDAYDRAKLTDFGFCIPEAMMSGSIVGTPVHMAPELLSGHYDSSVDVYAFGILFWYICAGQVRLPYVFEQFQNKEQLWTSVRKGIRPECLPDFHEACWNLMEQCWAAEPSIRPLLGDVQPQLEQIRELA